MTGMLMGKEQSPACQDPRIALTNSKDTLLYNLY